MNEAEAIVTGLCLIFTFVGGLISGANLERRAQEWQRMERKENARKRREN